MSHASRGRLLAMHVRCKRIYHLKLYYAAVSLLSIFVEKLYNRLLQSHIEMSGINVDDASRENS
jgi:hypothetical protein